MAPNQQSGGPPVVSNPANATTQNGGNRESRQHDVDTDLDLLNQVPPEQRDQANAILNQTAFVINLISQVASQPALVDRMIQVRAAQATNASATAAASAQAQSPVSTNAPATPGQKYNWMYDELACSAPSQAEWSKCGNNKSLAAEHISTILEEIDQLIQRGEWDSPDDYKLAKPGSKGNTIDVAVYRTFLKLFKGKYTKGTNVVVKAVIDWAKAEFTRKDPKPWSEFVVNKIKPYLSNYDRKREYRKSIDNGTFSQGTEDPEMIMSQFRTAVTKAGYKMSDITNEQLKMLIKSFPSDAIRDIFEELSYDYHSMEDKIQAIGDYIAGQSRTLESIARAAKRSGKSADVSLVDDDDSEEDEAYAVSISDDRTGSRAAKALARAGAKQSKSAFSSKSSSSSSSSKLKGKCFVCNGQHSYRECAPFKKLSSKAQDEVIEIVNLMIQSKNKEKKHEVIVSALMPYFQQ
ncbi:hypothetical protein GQ42DRAFT_3430 [Ramicandelaber brevisporus]|nr:hypothetical protein GQ42DRAFT_3430 [Ramicandelaber brevisporus]